MLQNKDKNFKIYYKIMTFSILIPALNEEKYIGKLLSSLKEQTYKDFEVIVIDGNSDDGTCKEVEKYKNSLDLKLVEAKVRNASLQRNLAAKNAKYDHFIFFDADVIPEKTFIEKLSKHIQRFKFDVATSWLEPLSSNKIDKLIVDAYNLLYLEPLKKLAPTGGGAFIYSTRKAFFNVKGFDEGIHLTEDLDFIKRTHKAGFKFRLLKDPKIRFSVRRIDKDGRMRFVKNMLKLAFFYHLGLSKKYVRDKKAVVNKFGYDLWDYNKNPKEDSAP